MFRLGPDRLDGNQSGVNFPVADPFELGKPFSAASTALSGERAERIVITRWQQRNSLWFLGISLMKDTRKLGICHLSIRRETIAPSDRLTR